MRLGPLRAKLHPLLKPKPGQQHLLKHQTQHALRMPRADLVRGRGAPVLAADVEPVVAERGHGLYEVGCYAAYVVAGV
jgi:hypothetical protein